MGNDELNLNEEYDGPTEQELRDIEDHLDDYDDWFNMKKYKHYIFHSLCNDV